MAPSKTQRAPARRAFTTRTSQKLGKQVPGAKYKNYQQSNALKGAIAPRGQGYYDAFKNEPQDTVTAFSIGPCTPIETVSRFQVAQQATEIGRAHV